MKKRVMFSLALSWVVTLALIIPARMSKRSPDNKADLTIVTPSETFQFLDGLLHGGSIVWSRQKVFFRRDWHLPVLLEDENINTGGAIPDFICWDDSSKHVLYTYTWVYLPYYSEGYDALDVSGDTPRKEIFYSRSTVAWATKALNRAKKSTDRTEARKADSIEVPEPADL